MDTEIKVADGLKKNTIIKLAFHKPSNTSHTILGQMLIHSTKDK